MSLVDKLMKRFGVDRDIASYVAKRYRGKRATREALKWQEYRNNGQVTVTEHGIHGSRPNDPATRNLWEDIT